MSDLPLATTRQFRAAVKQVMSNYYKPGYTDKTRFGRPSGNRTDDPKRYVMCYTSRPTNNELEAIEFILWTQGVTANTRRGNIGIRGTCVIPPKEKKT